MTHDQVLAEGIKIAQRIMDEIAQRNPLKIISYSIPRRMSW